MMNAPDQTDSQPEPVLRDSPAGTLFKYIERGLLMLAAIMTLVAAGTEVWSVYQRGSIVLADILLMFLYTEVIAMIAVFYTGKG